MAVGPAINDKTKDYIRTVPGVQTGRIQKTQAKNTSEKTQYVPKLDIQMEPAESEKAFLTESIHEINIQIPLLR